MMLLDCYNIELGGANPQLTGAYLKAAELTTTGQVTLNDVIKIMRYKATNGVEEL